MKKKYNDKFEPHNFDYSPNENKYSLSEYYIEVGRECYKYEGLKNKKNDILVYSTILTGLNNKSSYMFSYPNSYIANRLAMNDREVRRAVSNLEELKLIKVTHPSGNKRNIKVLKDLRYPPKEARRRKKDKNFIKVYDRIFYYPLITKPMVHVYSYYLALNNNKDYGGYITVSYKKVADSLGYSEKQLIDIIKAMKDIGLVFKNLHKYKKNIKAVRLEVDFSKKQPEEIEYENQNESKLDNSPEKFFGKRQALELDDDDEFWYT